MPIIFRTATADRTTGASGTFYGCNQVGGWGTGAGGSGFPANTHIPFALDTSGLEVVSEIRRARDNGGESAEGSDEPAAFDLVATYNDGDELADLRGVEIEGQDAALYFVGTIDGTTYTCASPYVIREGVIEPGSKVYRRGGPVAITGTPTKAAEPMCREFEGWGPAILLPDGGSGRLTWEVWDPSGDFAICCRFNHSVEDWVAGGTQTLMGNTDIRLRVIDSTVQAYVDHATTNAAIASPKLPRPEAFYVAELQYTASTKTAALLVWRTVAAGKVEQVYQGTNAGSGAITASGNTWVLGANVAESGTFLHTVGIHDWLFFDGLPSTTEYRSGPVLPAATNLYAWIEGEMGVAPLNPDAGPVVSVAAGAKTGIPATGHGLTIGGESAFSEFDDANNINGRHVIDAATTANQIVIAVAYVAETLTGSEVIGTPTTVYDKAAVNAGSRRDATAKGVRFGTSLSGGFPASTGSDIVEGTGADAGNPMARHLGPVEHVKGMPVTSDVAQSLVFLFGDPERGTQDFKSITEGGAELTISTYATSWLALFAASLSAGEAAVYPGGLGAKLEERIAGGAVSADIFGEGPGLRGMYFDGDDAIDFGASDNAAFIANWTVRLDLSVATLPTASAAVISNMDNLDQDGLEAYLWHNASGEFVLQVDVRHAVNLASVSHVFPAGDGASAEIILTEAFVVDGSDTDFTLSLYVDGFLSDSDAGTVATASLVAPANVLTLGARWNTVGLSYYNFLTGHIGNFSLASAAKSATWAADMLLADPAPPLAPGPAVDLGGGLVGLPVEHNPFTTGESVTVSGTTNYEGAQTIHADSTRVQIVITDTYNAETFDGTEIVHDADLTHHYPSRVNRALPAGDPYPAATLADEIGSLNGTITGATWRDGVAPTSARALAVYLDQDTGQPGNKRDLSRTADWPAFSLARSTANFGNPSRLTMLDVLISSLDGWRRRDPDQTLVLGWLQAPEDQTPDHTLTFRGDWAGATVEDGWREDWGDSPPEVIKAQYRQLGFTENAGELLPGATDPDRSKWASEYLLASAPVTNAATVYPYPKADAPPIIPGSWATRNGALTEAQRQAAAERWRRATAEGLLLGSVHLFGTLAAGDYVSITGHPLAPSDPAYAVVWKGSRQFGNVGEPVSIEFRRIKLS